MRPTQVALLHNIFREVPDMVVPAPSVFEINGAPSFPSEERVVFCGTVAMSHVPNFGDSKVHEQLLAGLDG